MRLGTFAIIVLGAATAFAQRSLNPVGTNGNVINPGVPLTGRSPVVSGPSFGSMPSLGTLPSLGGRLPSLGPLPPLGANFGAPGAARQGGFGQAGGRGYGGYGGGFRGGYGGGIGGGFIYVPVPTSGGSSYGTVHNPPPGQYDPIFGGYNPGVVYQPESGYAADYAPPQASPTVVINQYYQPETVHPVLQDYTNVRLPEPGQGPAPQAAPGTAPQAPAANGGSLEGTIYLIAMKDHTIYPALAYWVEKDTLNYVTMSGSPNRVSLSLVDRELSIRLNDERGLSFRVPAQ